MLTFIRLYDKLKKTIEKGKVIMKRIIAIFLLLTLSFSLFSCDKEGRVIDKATALIEDGKYKEAYELLYENKSFPEAAEMLASFTVNAEKVTNKNYEVYESFKETTYNEQGDPVKIYSDYTYVERYFITENFEYIYENGKMLQCLSKTDEESSKPDKIIYTYDENGNLIKFEEKRGLDESGNPSYTRYETYEYDENGNVTKKELFFDGVMNYRHTYEYDAKGNKTKETILNFENKTEEIIYTYDENGNLIKTFKPTEKYSLTNEYTYNDRGDVLSEKIIQEMYETDFTQTVDKIYEYEYDEKGNITKKITKNLAQDSQTVEETTYNENGDVTRYHKVIDNIAHTLQETEYEYFENGKIKKSNVKRNDWKEYELQQVYDEKGNLLKESSGDSKNTYEYTYDEKGNITKKKEIKFDGTPKYYEYTYNGNNELIKEITYYEGKENSIVYHEYKYNENGTLSEEKTNEDDFEKTYQYIYNDHGDLIAKDSISNGIAFSGDKYEYAYSEDGKMLSKKSIGEGDKVSKLSEYDENGNEIRVTYYIDGAEGRWHEKEYDENGNLIKMTTIGLDKNGEKKTDLTFTYTYDEFGVLLSSLQEGYSYGIYANLIEYFDYEYFYNGSVK